MGLGVGLSKQLWGNFRHPSRFHFLDFHEAHGEDLNNICLNVVGNNFVFVSERKVPVVFVVGLAQFRKRNRSFRFLIDQSCNWRHDWVAMRLSNFVKKVKSKRAKNYLEKS